MFMLIRVFGVSRPLSATFIGTAWPDSGRRSGSTWCLVLGSYAGKGNQRLFIKRNDHATMSAASARSVHYSK
jgi:hypothetical protein